MCLIPEWKTGLWAKAIDPWLSLFSGMTMDLFDLLLPIRIISWSLWMCRTYMVLLETLMRACCWSGWRSPNSVSSRRSHVASFAASIRATYSALVDDNATVGCLLEYQLTGPLLSIKMKPEVDFWLSLSPSQSESEYPLTMSLSWPL